MKHLKKNNFLSKLPKIFKIVEYLIKTFENSNNNNEATINYRIDLYIGPASVDWTSLTASKETGLEDVMLGVEVWLENMNESQYK